jgi:hypothetical protein
MSYSDMKLKIEGELVSESARIAAHVGATLPKVGEVPTFRPSELPIPIPIFRLYRPIFLVDFNT